VSSFRVPGLSAEGVRQEPGLEKLQEPNFAEENALMEHYSPPVSINAAVDTTQDGLFGGF